MIVSKVTFGASEFGGSGAGGNYQEYQLVSVVSVVSVVSIAFGAEQEEYRYLYWNRNRYVKNIIVGGKHQKYQ